jgi:hypothetical protein
MFAYSKRKKKLVVFAQYNLDLFYLIFNFQAERDSLIDTHHELEKQLVTRDLELHEKEEELFLQLEKVIRLEEDCEKLRTEKDKMVKWKDRLEREKNEAYKQLRLQAESSEITRRNLERARLDAFRQFSEIAAEKDTLEREVRCL